MPLSAILDRFLRLPYLVNIDFFLLFLRVVDIPVRHHFRNPVSLLDLFNDRWLYEKMRVAVDVVPVATSTSPASDIYDGTLTRSGRVERVVVKHIRLPRSPSTHAQVQASLTRKFIRECFVWSLLQHEHICPLWGLCKLEGYELPALVSPSIPHRSIDYLRNLPAEKLSVVRQAANGIRYLHDIKIIHGDVKSDNIMVDDNGRVQIIDFGLSKYESMAGFTTAQPGNRNPRYCAPELLRQEKEHGVIKPTFESDVFGLSMTMLQLLDGRGDRSIPYNHYRSDYDLWKQLIESNGAIERPQLGKYTNVPTATHDLLQRCWDELPANRSTITVVCNVLSTL